MQDTELFDRAALGPTASTYQARVVSVDDPERLSRVQVRLLGYDGVEGQDAPIWARVAVPFAGPERGAFFIPDVDDEVLITFLNGDPRLPVVIGSLWHGSAKPPEKLGGAGDRVDRWTIVGKAGTRIAIVEERRGEEKIRFSTPGGVTGELTDSGGGKIELVAGGSKVTLEPAGITLETGAKVKVQASQVEVTAGQVTVNAAMSTFNGIVKCDVIQATTVIGTTYTPGAGNVW